MQLSRRGKYLMLTTSKNIWTFNFKRFRITRFSFAKFEQSLERHSRNILVSINQKLKAESYDAYWAEYARRGAENAARAGHLDTARYSRMLREYQQFGSCDHEDDRS